MKKLFYILLAMVLAGCASMNIKHFRGPNDGRVSVVGDFKNVAAKGNLSVMMRVYENGDYDVTKTGFSDRESFDSFMSKLCPDGTKTFGDVELCSGTSQIKYNDIKSAVERSGVSIKHEYHYVYLFKRFSKDYMSAVFYTTSGIDVEPKALNSVVFR